MATTHSKLRTTDQNMFTRPVRTFQDVWQTFAMYNGTPNVLEIHILDHDISVLPIVTGALLP